MGVTFRDRLADQLEGQVPLLVAKALDVLAQQAGNQDQREDMERGENAVATLAGYALGIGVRIGLRSP